MPAVLWYPGSERFYQQQQKKKKDEKKEKTYQGRVPQRRNFDGAPRKFHGRSRHEARCKLEHVVRLQRKLAKVPRQQHRDPLLLAVIEC